MKKLLTLLILMSLLSFLAAKTMPLKVSAAEVEAVDTELTEEEETYNTDEELKKWANNLWSLIIAGLTSVGTVITVFSKFKAVKKTADGTAEKTKEQMDTIISDARAQWKAIGDELTSYEQRVMDGLDAQGIEFIGKMKEAVDALPISDMFTKIDGYKFELDTYSDALKNLIEIMRYQIETSALPQSQKEKVFAICNETGRILTEAKTTEEVNNNENGTTEKEV